MLQRRRRENVARAAIATTYDYGNSPDLEKSIIYAKSSSHASTGTIKTRPLSLKDEEISLIDLKRFIASMSKCIEARQLGLSFVFLDLSLKLDGNGKELLKSVSGRIDSGSMWAVMGSSGSGKCKISALFALCGWC